MKTDNNMPPILKMLFGDVMTALDNYVDAKVAFAKGDASVNLDKAKVELGMALGDLLNEKIVEHIGEFHGASLR
jgi:hypothetical protein